MKKKIALLGGTLFTTIKDIKGEYIPIYNTIVNELSLKGDIYNFSIENKDVKFYYDLATKLMDKNFSDVALALFDLESQYDTSFLKLALNDIKEDLIRLIEFFKELNVKVSLYLLKGNSKNIVLLNDLLIEVGNLYKINIIGKNNTYVYLNDESNSFLLEESYL